MSFSQKQKLLLAGFIFLIILIPLGSFVVSKSINQTSNTIPSQPVTSAPPKAKTQAPSSTLNQAKTDTPAEASNSSSPVANLNFGPVLNLKILAEGRSLANQALKAFVGIAQGTESSQPKYLLTFTVDFPASGEFKGLSLAGLATGTTYTAYIKGPSQIATASAFVVSPTETNLNQGQPLNMLSGDLNEDNLINTADYNLIKGLLGTTSTSTNWNSRADINGDGIINTVDLSYVSKNQGKTGSGGAWVSPIPTASASAAPNRTGGPEGGTGGYWLWVPSL